MISQFVKGKVYVFIDAANVFYSQKTLGWRISYERLINYFRRECNVEKCLVYTGVIPGNLKQKRFLDMLEINGYNVRTKEVKKVQVTEFYEKLKCNFDVEMTIDALDTMSLFDTAILVSGDSDFAPLVKRIKEAGKNVIVMSTRGHISVELLREAKFIDFEKLKEEISL